MRGHASAEPSLSYSIGYGSVDGRPMATLDSGDESHDIMLSRMWIDITLEGVKTNRIAGIKVKDVAAYFDEPGLEHLRPYPFKGFMRFMEARKRRGRRQAPKEAPKGGVPSGGDHRSHTPTTTPPDSRPSPSGKTSPAKPARSSPSGGVAAVFRRPGAGGVGGCMAPMALGNAERRGSRDDASCGYGIRPLARGLEFRL